VTLRKIPEFTILDANGSSLASPLFKLIFFDFSHLQELLIPVVDIAEDRYCFRSSSALLSIINSTRSSMTRPFKFKPVFYSLLPHSLLSYPLDGKNSELSTA